MIARIDWSGRVGRRLKLRDLHVFATVTQCGSMAKAAAQLGVSQPSVSEVIAALEHTFGVRLLDRSARGVEPTIYGRALLKRSTAAFDELRQSSRDIEFLSDATTGRLTIGCAESVAAGVLPAIVDVFGGRYPGVTVQVDDVPSPAFGLLRERGHDLILARVIRPFDEEEDLEVETLFNDPLVLAAGPDSRWAGRRKVGLDELTGETWILPPPESWAFVRVKETFAAQGLAMPETKFISLSVHLRTHLLDDGKSVSAFPMSVARRYGLNVLPIDLSVPAWPVVLVTLKNRTLSPIVERFIACAREVARATLARPSTRGRKAVRLRGRRGR
jgi:DNA-binding transcriptional LysR family regulator